jgi:uncharacterized surface protein with fasciclin (FAS1) repeats
MKKLFYSTSMVVLFILVLNLGYAQEKQTVAAAKTAVTKEVKSTMENTAQTSTITDVITASKNHSTLLAALKNTALLETLSGAGPFTVFAPSNDAFAKIPTTALEIMMKPEYNQALTKILTGHVLSGIIKSQDIIDAIKAGAGNAIFTTLNGEKITATEEKGKIKLTDAMGNSAYISTSNITAENGIIHSIDAVFGTK